MPSPEWKKTHDITIALTFHRYVAFRRRGVGSHARSRSAIPTAIRWSFVATASQLVEAAWSSNSPQYLQHGYAGALHAVLLPCNLRSSIQRESGPSYEQTVHVFHLLFFTLKDSSSVISVWFLFAIKLVRDNCKFEICIYYQMSVWTSKANRLSRSSAKNFSIGAATVHI